MKKLLFLIAVLSFNFSIAQIDIEDKSAEPKIEAKPYNGEFMDFSDYSLTEEDKAGVVGEKVTLINVFYSSFYASQEDLKNYNSVSFSLSDEFKNKTFEVVEYNYKYQDLLTIKNDKGTYVWKVSSTDNYIFNKYIDKIKERFVGKSFIPLHLKSEFESLEGTKFNIEGQNKYIINKVTFAKLGIGYGIVFEINDNFECVFPNSGFDQPKLFNGKIYKSNDNYINIQSSNIFESKVTLIEESEYKSFSLKNKTYLSSIRKKNVAVGMNEDQCRWSWGIPDKSYKNIAGYDEVLEYGSQNLYFKKGILKLIR